MTAPVRLDLDATREIADRELHVSDGQHFAGTILALGRAWLAFDPDGAHRGTHTSQQAALSALPPVGAAHAG